VSACDEFVFVTPEYNHSFPAALKNAIDYLYAEWQHKPAGTVSYGITGGVRAVEALRLVLIEVGAVPIAAQVALSVVGDFTYADDTDLASPFQVTARDTRSALCKHCWSSWSRMPVRWRRCEAKPTPSMRSRLARDDLSSGSSHASFRCATVDLATGRGDLRPVASYS